MAEALRTAGKMTDTLLKRFILVENPNGMIGKQLIPISSPQIKFLLVQRPFGTYNYRIFEGKYHGTACLHVHVIYTRKLAYCAQRKKHKCIGQALPQYIPFISSDPSAIGVALFSRRP